MEKYSNKTDILDNLVLDDVDQLTQEAFDERFYTHPKKENPLTGLPYFPSATFILDYLPYREKKMLVEWTANKGYDEAMRYMNHRGNIGTFVHDKAEQMVKHGFTFKKSQIEEEAIKMFGEYDANFILRALTGFMNFVDDEVKEFLMCEQRFIAEDFGGCADLAAILKSSPKSKTLIDLKTSASKYASHEIQVEAYRRALGYDTGAVLVLGNKTKKMYTLSKTPVKRHADLWAKFSNAKEACYLYGKMYPTKPEYRDEFKIQLDGKEKD